MQGNIPSIVGNTKKYEMQTLFSRSLCANKVELHELPHEAVAEPLLSDKSELLAPLHSPTSMCVCLYLGKITAHTS